LTPDEAIGALVAQVAAGRAIGGAGADDRGPETAGGSLWLRREGDLFVIEEATWHEYNGTRDRESLTVRRRTEQGLREMLGNDRSLLESLLADWRGSGAPLRLTAPDAEEMAMREARLDAACAATWRRLQAGEWWLGQGKARGLLQNRAVQTAHDDRLRWLSIHDPMKLKARLRTALRSDRPLSLGALPPAIASDLRCWLDADELAQEVARDAVVVSAFEPAWCSHEEGSPESSQELVAWSAHGISPAKDLRASAPAELGAALRVAGAWIARRTEKPGPRPASPAASTLVEKAVALAAERPLSGVAVAPDGTREEHELRREQGSWVRIRRVAPEGAGPGEVDEHRSIDNESETRAALSRQLEWLAPAVAQRDAR
jgi:hypothetical protein